MARQVSRRRLLGETALGTGALWAAAAGFTQAPAAGRARFASYPFTLGVASGDPLPDGVVLWTRLAPDPLADDGRGGLPERRYTVRWEVAEDEAFRRRVAAGRRRAVPELGHAVHAEVSGLAPGREYFFRFIAGDEVSPVGRTRTAPAGRVDQVRLGLASCQAWVGGRYAAYRTMAEEDLDLVVHVGDYIYEGRNTESLTDFRLLHARYKTSPDLQAAHARFPFVVTWDDHEIENNWADGASQPDGEASNEPGRFAALRAAAFQAYYEHLPLRRPQRPAGPDLLLYRGLAWGDLLDMSVLDTRQYRSDQLDDAFPAGERDPRTSDPGRTMTGAEQERWLMGRLGRSQARWNVLAQQTIVARFDYDPGEGVAFNHDQWDGYEGARDRLLGFVAESGVRNPIVLTGDWHSSWVNDLKADFTDPRSATVATEFVGTSISSGCPWAPAVAAALPANPHVRFFDGERRGWVRHTVTPERWTADYRTVPAPDDAAAPATTLTSWSVESGRPGAVEG
jgi:alkaline phosphatase D